MLPLLMSRPRLVSFLLLLPCACGGRADLSEGGPPSGATAGTRDAGAAGSVDVGDASPPADGGTDGSTVGEDAGGDHGSLHFGPAQKLPYSEIGFPRSLVMGDVNGDGRNDVVLGNDTTFNQPNVLVFLQTSAGTLPSAPITYAFGGGPMRIADLNGDARNDIVFTTINGFGVALQKSDGSLGSPTMYPLSTFEDAVDVVVGDFDGDSRTDVVLIAAATAVGFAGNAYLRSQMSDGSLGEPKGFSVPGGGWSSVGDANGDGLLDVVTLLDNGLNHATQISILPLRAPGAFGTAYTAELDGEDLGGSLAVGDLNGDGADDTVVAVATNRPDAEILVSLQGKGTLTPPARYTSMDVPEDVHIADVNLDGRNDVVVVHGGWFAVGVYLQRADGSLADEVTLSSSYGEGVLGIGDVSGDGKPDIVTADQGSLIVFHNEN